MNKNVDKRLSEAKAIAGRMLNGRMFSFAELKPSDLEDGLAVVYAIFRRDTGEALYVGRTKNLRQRLYANHLMGPESNARLKKYLVQDETLPHIRTLEDAKQFLRDYCCFQYIAVPDTITRGQVEGLLSFLLDVRYMHEEH